MTPAVLLNIDDHEAARYARTRILTNAGFRVFEGASAEETLALVAEHHPDLVLLDVHLPDVDGIEVCRRLKQKVQETPIMILQITASALSPLKAKESLDAGADAYMMEPVDPDVLIATVNSLLRLHRAERSLSHANRQLAIVNQELQRSNQDLQQFAFAASHDLQEPLRTISTFIQLIQEDQGALSEQQRQYFELVRSAASRMRTLISDLLAYSQVGREGRPPQIIEVRDAVTTAISNLREPIQESGATIDVPDELPSILADSVHLVSVFHNVMSNSIKYRSPERSLQIQISAEQTSPVEWTICVRDNGIGIDERHQKKIFEPFKRLHGQDIPGTGMGLALCRRIIEASGGRIWVESRLGEGSAFYIALPAA